MLDGSELLALWERGLPRHALDRAALLAAAARPDWPAEQIADLPLGTVASHVLRLRAANFGPRIQAHVDCRHCGQRLSFDLDIDALLADAPVPATQHAEVAGLRLRAACLRDLAAVAMLPPDEAEQRLLARCTVAGDAQELDAVALAQVERALDALDPQADWTLALQCVGCGRADLAQLDAAALVWDEFDLSARALLADVHQLASAYGWSEPEVLALTPARREHYLGMTAGVA